MDDFRARSRRLLAASGALALTAALLAAGAAHADPAPPTQVSVTDSDLAAARPAAAAGWWTDLTNSATAGVTRNGPDGDTALELHLPSSSAKSYAYRSFATNALPTDIEALRAGASYTYSGTNVNFQFEIVFKPLDPAYGPNPADATKPGDDYCDQANAWGFTDVPSDWCYTVLKWEPLETVSGEWKTVDLTADTAVNSAASPKIGGWRTQKRVGIYAKAGIFSGSGTWTQYLAQIEELKVTAIVVGAGSGTPGPVSGFVKNITVGNVSYDFELEPEEPAAPPAANTDELLDLIDDEGIDVDADTDRFVPTGQVNSDLGKVDRTKPLNGRYENWQDSSDAFADVYSFSDARFIGTFPIRGGHVILTDANLKHLKPGPHHLLFRGQTSGHLAVVSIRVVAGASGGATLPPTGADPLPFGLVGLAILGAGSALVLRRRPTRAV